MIDQVQSEFRIQTRCTHCGRLNWSRKKNVGLMGTCRGCGGKFTIAETALRTCPECRELMSAEDVVCKKCGHDPRADEQASALTSLAEVADATGEPAAELTYATETAGDVARRPRRYRAVPWVAGALDVLGA
ncbi:MAG: hypothetical protein HUU27_08180, partial [Phycisphaerae bacterium]|nr:hypothetical protein [Phycisphaerae bacterium]